MEEPEIKEELLVIIDHRERHSAIVRELSKQGINIELHKLEIGDYLLSENVVVEYKTQSDFVNSIIDGRLLEQAINLRKYPKPLIIIEGSDDLFSQRNVHPNAIRGMLSTISLQFKIPILYTKNPVDTANLLIVIAKQEQEKKPGQETLHTTKPKTDREMQEYIVASLPGIGVSLAKPLLEQFGTVKKLFMANQERLEKVNLIGKKKAERIREILDKEY
jgi:ERCC4-type nuclease